jgi:hypothetical protein
MTVVRLLAEEVWAVAAINPLVGSSLMAIAVPRTAARTSGALELIGGQPLPGHITAWYLPGPDASEVAYMPNLAGAGTMMADATLEPL